MPLCLRQDPDRGAGSARPGFDAWKAIGVAVKSPSSPITDYYTRLEQGRDLSPSDAVFDRLTGALDLDEAAARHLQHLARPAKTAQHGRATCSSRRAVDAGLLDRAARLRPGRCVATNALLRALLTDFNAMPYKDRKLTRWILLEPAARDLYVGWAQIASFTNT